MNFRSPMKVVGHVCIELTNGKETSRYEMTNLTVNKGYDILARMILGTDSDSDRIAYIAIGTGGHLVGDIDTPIPPRVTDTQLETEVGRAPIYQFLNPERAEIQFRTTIDAVVAPDSDITEAGLLTEDSTLFARVTFPSVHKGDGYYLIVTWTVTLSERQS